MFGHSTALVVMAMALLILLAIGRCGRAGFTRTEAAIILGAAVIGVLLPPSMLRVHLVDLGGLSLGGNVLGVGIPLLLSVKVALRTRISPARALGGLILMVFVSFELSAFDPGVGIVVQHFVVVPIVGALLAIVVRGPTDHRSPPLAYFYSTLGLLIGADLLRLPQILSEVGGVSVTIGGAGISDALFLAGIIAVAMDAAVAYLAEQGPGSTRTSTGGPREDTSAG